MFKSEFVSIVIVCGELALMFRGKIDAFSLTMIRPCCVVAFVDSYLQFDYLSQIFLVWDSRCIKPTCLEDCHTMVCA